MRRIPEFKEKDAPVAFGNPASLDGVRPAAMQVNLRKPSDVFKFGMRTLAYHEAIPEHAFQLTLAQNKAFHYFASLVCLIPILKGGRSMQNN